MRILFLSSEVAPYAKTGGLADVSGALPDALAALGHDVSVFMPLYRCVREGDHEIAPAGVEQAVPVPGAGRTETARLWRAATPPGKAAVLFVELNRYFDRPELYGEDNEAYADNLERFAFFVRASLECDRPVEARPDIVHANDWQCALAPSYLKTLYAHDERFAGARSLLTVHNLAYQGLFDAAAMTETGLDEKRFNWKELEFYGRLSLLKGGLVQADGVNTVSPTYAKEIQTPRYGCGLDGVLLDRGTRQTGNGAGLHGILNGIDVHTWDPASDPHLPARYSAADPSAKSLCKRGLQQEAELPESDEPLLIGMVGRLVDQKGCDLLLACADVLLERPVQLVVLGTGEPAYERALTRMAEEYPDRVCTWIGFDEGRAHRIEAGADVFLMPSRYEPCGLNQMYSLRYGTLPIVRRTGGLADTVVDATARHLNDETATGFVFLDATAKALLACVDRACELFKDKTAWAQVMTRGMKQDFSWASRAAEYISLYRTLRQSPPHVGP